MIMELGKMQWLQYGYKTANPFGCRKEAFLKKNTIYIQKYRRSFFCIVRYAAYCLLSFSEIRQLENG